MFIAQIVHPADDVAFEHFFQVRTTRYWVLASLMQPAPTCMYVVVVFSEICSDAGSAVNFGPDSTEGASVALWFASNRNKLDLPVPEAPKQ